MRSEGRSARRRAVSPSGRARSPVNMAAMGGRQQCLWAAGNGRAGCVRCRDRERAAGPGAGEGPRGGGQCRGVRRQWRAVRARGAAAGVEGRRGLGEGPGSCEGLRAGTPSPAGVTHGSSHPAVVALALASEAAFVEDLDES